MVAGASLAVTGLGTVGLTGVADAAAGGEAGRGKAGRDLQTQFDWAYCANCAGLWYTSRSDDRRLHLRQVCILEAAAT